MKSELFIAVTHSCFPEFSTLVYKILAPIDSTT